MKEWIEDAWWSWKCCIHFRFDYNDRIDVAAFWGALNFGWYQMEDEYTMSDPNFDPWNLRGRDTHYSYKVSNK